eukprot:8134068-Pyramimonas_sp.AAC.1
MALDMRQTKAAHSAAKATLDEHCARVSDEAVGWTQRAGHVSKALADIASLKAKAREGTAHALSQVLEAFASNLGAAAETAMASMWHEGVDPNANLELLMAARSYFEVASKNSTVKLPAESSKVKEKIAEAVPKFQGALTLQQFLPYLVSLTTDDFKTQEKRQATLETIHGFLRETNADNEIPSEIGDRSIELMGLLSEDVLKMESGYASDGCGQLLPVFDKLVNILNSEHGQKREHWNKEIMRMRTVNAISADVAKYNAVGEKRLDSPDAIALLDKLTCCSKKLEDLCSQSSLPIRSGAKEVFDE